MIWRPASAGSHPATGSTRASPLRLALTSSRCVWRPAAGRVSVHASPGNQRGARRGARPRSHCGLLKGPKAWAAAGGVRVPMLSDPHVQFFHLPPPNRSLPSQDALCWD